MTWGVELSFVEMEKTTGRGSKVQGAQFDVKFQGSVGTPVETSSR